LPYCRSIISNFKQGDIILIGGSSRSGKTTFANNLRLALQEKGYTAWTLSLDRWLKDVGSRSPGVLGRYDLSIIHGLISRHATGLKRPERLNLPEYCKLQQRTFFTGESILIQPEDILIIEGVIALILARGVEHIQRYFIEIDESVRKYRVLEEYIARGRDYHEAEAIYLARQLDEYPVINQLSVGAIHINIMDLCSR